MVRSGREAPISRRYRTRAGRWGRPTACRSRSRSARRIGSRGANRSASPSRPPHPNRNRPKAWSQPAHRSSPSQSQRQSRLAKASHRNRSPLLNCPRFWGRRKRWSRRRPRNQPRCPNRPAKPHHPNSPANPNGPTRPRLRDAADSCFTRSPPPASSSLRHWSITGVCCPESVPIPVPVRRRSAVLPIARSCYLRWAGRRSCTLATRSARRPRPRKHRRSRRVRRPSHQGRRTQPLDQPGRWHLRKACSPRWAGYASQQDNRAELPSRPVNLWQPADGTAGHDYTAHGSFDQESKPRSVQLWASHHHGLLGGAVLGLAGTVAVAVIGRRARR